VNHEEDPLLNAVEYVLIKAAQTLTAAVALIASALYLW
jgi:hypothetical protein